MSCRVPLFIRRGGTVLYKGKEVTVLDYSVDYAGVEEMSPQDGKLVLLLETGNARHKVEYSYKDIKPTK